MTSTLLQITGLEILEKLSQSAMATVFRARQVALDRIVVVKVLPLEAASSVEARARFENEARLSSALSHPNIVKTVASGIANSRQPYLVMEYIEGHSLAQELAQNGPLNLQQFGEIFLPVLNALEAAHQAGLVHRDIKPDNIMLCKSDTKAITPKLVDFGVAKVNADTDGQSITKTGQIVGTPQYMSPEQCQGKPIDGRSDLYSLACVMYEALTGAAPFQGQSAMATMQKHIMEPAPTVSELSKRIDIRKELAAVILSGLAKAQEQRPASANEFAKNLSTILEKMTLDRVPRFQSAATKRRQLGTAAILLFTITAGMVLLSNFIHSHRQDPGEVLSSNRKDEKRTYSRCGISFLYPRKWSEVYDGEEDRICTLRLLGKRANRGAYVVVSKYSDARQPEKELKILLDNARVRNDKVRRTSPIEIKPGLTGYEVICEYNDRQSLDPRGLVKHSLQEISNPDRQMEARIRRDVTFFGGGATYLFSLTCGAGDSENDWKSVKEVLETIEFSNENTIRTK